MSSSLSGRRCLPLIAVLTAASLSSALLITTSQEAHAQGRGRAGAGARPGVGVGAPGAGVRPGVGVGAPGAGVRPGVGVGAPGVGVRPGVGVGAPGTWNRAWVQGGYWSSRPWTTGWYRVNPVAWGWWGTRSMAWGLTSLATAAAITSLVNASAQQQTTVIVVPETTIQLDYSTVQAVPPRSASFLYAATNGSYQSALVDCNQGLFNGQAPDSANLAQVLNAVCQIAYGSA